MVNEQPDTQGSALDLVNATAINVVALLQEPVGGRRTYRIQLATFRLSPDLAATDLQGQVRLTRLRNEILARVEIHGTVAMECVRCLRTYPQPVEATFSEEYRPSVDVRTGAHLDLTREGDVEEDEIFLIDEHHELDLAEALRQNVLLALPMRPWCGPECPGPDMSGSEDEADVDERLAALAALLDEEQ